MAQSYSTKLGIIGGSGVYDIPGISVVKEHALSTPFGDPSGVVEELSLGGRSFYFIPRHGKFHQFLPSEVNYRANIYALKTLGVTHLLAVSAVGIMTEEIKPGDMVVPDQIFDRTRGDRASTFFGQGIVGHVPFADPFSEEMREIIIKAAKKETDRVYKGGTYICMEGPQFSTRAESNFYRRSILPAVIGMTGLPEAKLAREAEMCYGMLALATDYDCWNDKEEDVSVEAVLDVLKANSTLAARIVAIVAAELPEYSQSPDLEACKHAIITKKEAIPEQRKKDLAPLYGRYF